MGGINILTTAIACAHRHDHLADAAAGVAGDGGQRAVHAQCRAAHRGVVMLLLDRMVGTGFFLPEKGADRCCGSICSGSSGIRGVCGRVPGLGIIQEILPVFGRKPIFGYRTLVWSAIAAGILSFMVWAHHMF